MIYETIVRIEIEQLLREHDSSRNTPIQEIYEWLPQDLMAAFDLGIATIIGGSLRFYKL